MGVVGGGGGWGEGGLELAFSRKTVATHMESTTHKLYQHNNNHAGAVHSCCRSIWLSLISHFPLGLGTGCPHRVTVT